MSNCLASMLFLLVFLLGIAAMPGHAANNNKRGIISPVQAVMMVRTALVALNHANITGNYTVLRELAAPQFQFSNTPARLAEVFASLRRQKIDLAPVVVINPVFTRTPFINQRGILVLTGYFPSRPQAVLFTLGYLPIGGIWKLNYISVNTQPAKALASPASQKKAGKASGKKTTKRKQATRNRKTSKAKARPRSRPNRNGKGDLKQK